MIRKMKNPARFAFMPGSILNNKNNNNEVEYK